MFAVVRNFGKENQEVVDTFTTLSAAREELKWESSWDCEIATIAADGRMSLLGVK